MASALTPQLRSPVEAVKVLTHDVVNLDTSRERVAALPGVSQYARSATDEEREALIKNGIIAGLLGLIMIQEGDFVGLSSPTFHLWGHSDDLAKYQDDIVSICRSFYFRSSHHTPRSISRTSMRCLFDTLWRWFAHSMKRIKSTALPGATSSSRLLSRYPVDCGSCCTAVGTY